MTPTECLREADVVGATAFGRWEPALRDHVAGCSTCAEVAEIARALHEEHATACHDARVPAAGIVSWRSTIRARAEAARTAAQPISVLQGIAGACAVGLGCGLVSAVWRSAPSFGGVGALVEKLEIASPLSPVLAYAVPLVLGLAACLVIAPLALYFTLGDE